MTTEGYVTGLVSVEDGNPPKSGNEYDPRRKVRVEIGFAYDVNGDASAALDRAAALADAKLNALLNRPLTATEIRTTTTGDVAPKATRTRKAADKPPVAEEVKGDDPFEVAPDSPEVLAERAKLAAELAADQAKPAEEVDEFTVQPAVDEFDMLTTAPPKEITDADLNAAVQKKNGEINNSQAIRELIGAFNPDPKRAFQLREIPADKRQAFLDKLGELKKAA